MRLEEQLSLLKEYNINFVRTRKIDSISKLSFDGFSFPCVMKPFSSKGIHKTELGVIFTNIISRTSGLKAFEDIVRRLKNNKIEFEGVIIQEKVVGIEIIIGCKKDETFGRVVTLGFGGVLTEIIKEVSFRALPISSSDVREMIKECRLHEVLNARGGAFNEETIVSLVMSIVRLVREEKLQSFEVNPAIVTPKEVFCVDVRME